MDLEHAGSGGGHRWAGNERGVEATTAGGLSEVAKIKTPTATAATATTTTVEMRMFFRCHHGRGRAGTSSAGSIGFVSTNASQRTTLSVADVRE